MMTEGLMGIWNRVKGPRNSIVKGLLSDFDII